MIKISNLRLPPAYGQADLHDAIAAALHTDAASLRSVRLLRQAIDARKKSDVHYVVSALAEVEDEAALLRQGLHNVRAYEPAAYRFPYVNTKMSSHRPIVVGSGPAGLFCALCLAQAGMKPLLIERGQDVAQRARDVAQFFRTGQLDITSNVQFGEGGAGTFSDGKLATGTKDVRQRYVLEQYAEAGAPENILYLAKPHIGTDKLRTVARNMRARLLALGGDIAFGTQLADVGVQNGVLSEVEVTGPEGVRRLPVQQLVLAVGHSARDTFEMLHARGVSLVPKAFAVGVRIEHLQQEVDLAQYGSISEFKTLPASDYKLVHHTAGGRSAFTFCVCPGGTVVAAASEQQMTVTNGMSASARNGPNCNGALLVDVGPADFPSAYPLAGIGFQRELERRAYALGGGSFLAPAQRVGDFLDGRPSTGFGAVKPTYLPGVQPADLSLCLPGYIVDTLRESLPFLGKKIRGFDAADAVLTAVESRSSSPVRITRDEAFQTNIKGIYACGEGAGYAGGILSSAVDGVKCAEAICSFVPLSSTGA